MGKKSKKKQSNARKAPAKPSAATSPTLAHMARVEDAPVNKTLHGCAAEVAQGDDVPGAAMCRHLERGVNLEKLSTQLAKAKATLIQCQDCSKDSKLGMGKKGKGRSSKKKVTQSKASQNGSNGTKRWVCLACGHVGCGGISSSTASYVDENGAGQEGVGAGHAWKHWLLAKHPLAVDCGDKLVCWCFQCNTTVDYSSTVTVSSEHNDPAQVSSEHSEHEDSGSLKTLAPPGIGMLQQAVKQVREKLVKESVSFKDFSKGHATEERSDSTTVGLKPSLDRGNSTLGSKPNSEFDLISDFNKSIGGESGFAPKKRVVRGLMNLGNTCFFNSVMQNLLALSLVQDYFCQDSWSIEGPLTSSLRRLYLETNAEQPTLASKSFAQIDMNGFESGLKRGGKGRVSWENSAGGAYNPRSLFGAICSKAPRFRGFQQQDSHELLRCLLDGLHLEEQSIRSTQAKSARVNSSGKEALSSQDVCNDAQDLTQGEQDMPNTHKQVDTQQMPTFVDRFFGGQLSSTVCCCECGHSSVVYEPFLDLSLQIPSTQSSKKLQGRAAHLTSSCLGGRVEKGYFQKELNNIKASEKVEALVSSQTSKQAETEHREVQSATLSTGETSGVARVGPINCDSSDDFGWMDYLGGGTQSAEGSFQGPDDSKLSMEHLDKQNGFVTADAENIITESSSTGITGFRPGCLVGNGGTYSEKANDFRTVKSGEEPIETSGVFSSPIIMASQCTAEEPDVAVPSKAVTNGQDSMNQVITGLENQEQQALPLTSEVPLLPYEKLQVPSQKAVGEAGDHIHVEKCNLEISFHSTHGDNDALSSTVFAEQDEGDYEGFSQLFEEEESFLSKDQREEQDGGMDNLQIIPENPMDATGEVNAKGPDVPTMGTSKYIEYHDFVLPMSLESCLADFTKSELLSGENAWGCEHCSHRLATISECKKSDQDLSVALAAIKQSNGKLRKGKVSKDCTDISGLAEKDALSQKDLSNGALSHQNFMVTAVSSISNSISRDRSDVRGSSLTEIDASKESVESTCEEFRACTEANSNGDSSEYPLNVKDVLLCTGRTAVDPLFCNGISRLNELDSGQSGRLSVSCQTEIDISNNRKQENCNGKVGDVAVNEFASLGEEKGTTAAEVQQRSDRGEDNMNNNEAERIQKTVSANSLRKKQQQIGCLDLGDLISRASSSRGEAEQAVTFRRSGKFSKSQRDKNRKVEVESEKIVKRDATKRLLISKAPPILTIHLKRFAQDMRGRLSKLSGHVAFQEWLDLRPFLDPKCLDSENCTYRLVGIVEHGGTMRGGHYIAYVRSAATSDEVNEESEVSDKSCWYYISDSHVQKSTLKAVLNSEAYLLFYEKCKVI